MLEDEKFEIPICLRELHLCCRFCCELHRHNAWVHSIWHVVLTPFSLHNHGFCGGPNTFSQEKNTRVYRNTVTCVTRVTSNRVEVHCLNSQHLARYIDDKHSRASTFRYFLSTTMVFAAVRAHFPKKNTRVYDNRAAINKQLFKY